VEPTSRSRLRGFARWRLLAAAVGVAAIAAPAAWLATSAQPEAARVVADRSDVAVRVVTFPYAGAQRRYRIFVPTHTPTARRGLLLVLHQLGGSAARFEQQSGLDRRAAAAGAVVVYADGLGHSWDAGGCCGYAVRHHVDDVRFLTRVVADVERRVSIDPARIAVTGFSNGALMSYRLLCERPDVFSVAVVVAGDAVGPRCNPALPVSILHVHGGRDAIIPLSGEPTSPLATAGFPPAAASIERLAVADQCIDAVTTTTANGAEWDATGCAGGVAVQLRTVTSLNHHYPSGPNDRNRFGLDMSTLTWSFVQSAWSGR
jgi:polyhydroxybutyrate depolymerase